MQENLSDYMRKEQSSRINELKSLLKLKQSNPRKVAGMKKQTNQDTPAEEKG